MAEVDLTAAFSTVPAPEQEAIKRLLTEIVDQIAQDAIVPGVAADPARGRIEDPPRPVVVATAIALDRLLPRTGSEQTRDGAIHVTYSYFTPEGKSIKHARFNEDWVRAGDPSR